MKKLSWTLLIIFFFCLNISSAIVLFSPAKKWVQNRFSPQEQEVLSIVHGDLINNGSSIKVVKSRTVEGVVLEFYSEIQNGSRYLITRALIPNANDGFFDHRGQAVQLAVVDIDGDGTMELLSPTFDDKMLARLNPYYYSPAQKAFVPFFFSGTSY